MLKARWGDMRFAVGIRSYEKIKSTFVKNEEL